MELSVIESGRTLEIKPQKSVGWCGRTVQLLPVGLAGVAGVISGGTAIYEGVDKNWVGVGLCVFVVGALLIVTICYYRDIPIKTIEQSAEDMENQNRDLTKRVSDLQAANAQIQQENNQFKVSVAEAKANEQKVVDNFSKAQADLKAVTDQLSSAKAAFNQIQAIDNQFRAGMSELAKQVLSIASGNDKLKQLGAEINASLQKMDNLGSKIDADANELKHDDDQLDSRIDVYKKLLAQLGTFVTALAPESDVSKQSQQELDALRGQNTEMQKEIVQLKELVVKLEKDHQAYQSELKQLLMNLNDPKIKAALEQWTKSKK